MWFPGPLGSLINPFYFARKGLAEGVGHFAHHITGTVLDVGCGVKPYRDLYPADAYIGMEIFPAATGAKDHAEILYDGRRFPIGDSTIDAVVLNQVLEHAFHPDELLSEIHRVLTADGTLLVTVPFLWDEHEQPHDYARYTSFGLKYLIEHHGFQVIEQHKSMSGAHAVTQLLNGYLYKLISRAPKVLRLPATLLLIAPFNLLGALAAPLLPRNTDLYLDNIVVARKERRK